ncbi:peptide transporter family 1-like isoform X2 [Diachasmimorpha longicaudata]|uniref:peptide transporter family 1-like isoform X2 n=1 Tax=Diachasmimorpha longicaudata TaxID=58733 RepID=UPI0030B87885
MNSAMTQEVNEEKKKKKLKYPKSVFFIVSNEFCERFSYYGMRTILALYLKNKLDYSDNTATVIYHIFTMFVYFFPLFGAMLADSVLGKFRTIFYLSIVYALGQLLLSASAVPTFGLPIRECSIIGLLLIALGTGGIKPCVAAFGGDQFILPEQEKYLITFFSVFYFAINSGSLISTFLTPELRNNVKCFGDQECFSVAFLVPAVLMIVSVVIFLSGKSLYRLKEPEGNVVLEVVKCMSRAIYKKAKTKKVVEREHWLDYADDKYDSTLISDIKSALQIMTLFIPLPFFWALFDQQGSRWTFQATRMDGQIGNFLLKPDQMQVVNPLFIVIFIPIFETCVYPLMAKMRSIDTPLKKLTTGGILAAVAFILSAIVELKLETTYPVLPTDGTAQLRILNPRDCTLPILINNQTMIVKPFGIWEDIGIRLKGHESITYSADFSQCNELQNASLRNGIITVVEGQAISYVLEPVGSYAYKDYNNKSTNGNPAIRLLTYNTLKPNAVTRVKLSKVDYDFTTTTTRNLAQITPLADFSPGEYDVKVNDVNVGSIEIKLGGVYTLQIYVTANATKMGLTTITPPNSVHILWLIPQYIVITMGEVMFSVTGLEFAFTQAPVTMKSLLQAAWLMTVAFGNLIVVIIAEAKIFDRQALEFFLFAALMLVDISIFAVMAKFYKYKTYNDHQQTDHPTNENIPLGRKNGHLNESFSASEENVIL